MNRIFSMSLILLFMIIGNCKPSNEGNKENLHSFFSKTDWKGFNEYNLKKNNLSHFLSNKIDFYHREAFFKVMKNPKYNISYDDFYLVEIEDLETERTMSRKIIAINNDNEITYLFFKNSEECSAKGNFSNATINKYKYEKMTEGKSRDSDEYIIVSKISGDKY